MWVPSLNKVPRYRGLQKPASEILFYPLKRVHITLLLKFRRNGTAMGGCVGDYLVGELHEPMSVQVCAKWGSSKVAQLRVAALGLGHL